MHELVEADAPFNQARDALGGRQLPIPAKGYTDKSVCLLIVKNLTSRSYRLNDHQDLSPGLYGTFTGFLRWSQVWIIRTRRLPPYVFHAARLLRS